MDPVSTAASLGSRSLRDPELLRFVTQNLGHAPATWDFDALTWVAFYYQPSLEVARAQWETAQGAGLTANARPNPTITVTPGYNSSASGGVSPWFPGINLDWVLETHGKRDLRTTIERFNAESARLNILASAWQVRGELHQALIEIAVAERRVALLREQADLQRQLEALSQQRFTAGSAAASEVAPIRAARLRAELAAEEAQRSVADARSRAAQALGLPMAALADLHFPEPAAGSASSATALAAARGQSLQNRADVLAALAHYEASRTAVELEVAKQNPDFHIGPGYQWDQEENKWSVGVSLELPVFNRNEGPIAEAVGRLREAAAQVVLVQAQAIAGIDGAAAQQAAAGARLARLRDLEADARRQSALAEQRFANGSAGQEERQNARMEISVTQLALLEAGTDSALAAARLEDALQAPFANLDPVTKQPAPSFSPSSP